MRSPFEISPAPTSKVAETTLGPTYGRDPSSGPAATLAVASGTRAAPGVRGAPCRALNAARALSAAGALSRGTSALSGTSTLSGTSALAVARMWGTARTLGAARVLVTTGALLIAQSLGSPPTGGCNLASAGSSLSSVDLVPAVRGALAARVASQDPEDERTRFVRNIARS